MVHYKKIITLLCLIFTTNISLNIPEKIHTAFLKHDTSHVRVLFENMYRYIDSKSEKLDYNHQEMMSTYKTIYKDACVYLLNNKNNSVYLGWVPLKNETLLLKYYKNITKKIDFEINIKNVPLYYIICESNSLNNTLQIKKILNNPTIDLNIDMTLLKDDLFNLAEQYNTTLDLSYLKTYDNGRWFLTFNF